MAIARVVTAVPDSSRTSRTPVTSTYNSTMQDTGGVVTSKNHSGNLTKSTFAQYPRNHHLTH